MKKILSSVFILLLLILAYFIIFKGISFGEFNILSVGQISDANTTLTNKIDETNSLLKKDFVSEKNSLSSAVSDLLQKKQEYFNLAKISTTGELKKANTQETYLIEYLWTRVGRHATGRGVNIKMDVMSADAGDREVKNLSFNVQGQYPAIIEFLYAIEGDSELNFRISSFKILPNGSNSTLVATFYVNGVRIKNETVTTSTSRNSSVTSSPSTIDRNTGTQSTNNSSNSESIGDTTSSPSSDVTSSLSDDAISSPSIDATSE